MNKECLKELDILKSILRSNNELVDVIKRYPNQLSKILEYYKLYALDDYLECDLIYYNDDWYDYALENDIDDTDETEAIKWWIETYL